MKDDIFTKVIETVRGVPSEYDSTVENITGKILSQNNLKHAEILERFVDEWNHSESSKDSIVIAWLLSDRFLGTGEPAVRKVFADRLLEKIDPEDNRLNPERLQEWIRSVIFSDEESIETLRNALIASKQIPKTTSNSGNVGGKKKPEKKLEPLPKGFSFGKGQAFFKNRDLELPTGVEVNSVEILKKLVKSFGKVVLYKNLDENSADTASDFLRGKIRTINLALKKHKVPCKIQSKKWVGYVLSNSRRHY